MGHAGERLLHGVDRIGRSEQLLNVGFGEEERQAANSS
jgi:hypothetical protein